ncbi:MAG: hypothetical protein FJ109_02450 [Deltaproteobacteria bacterium]|nr:hypothetical protein [Deltaproteobacteria bacterium]
MNSPLRCSPAVQGLRRTSPPAVLALFVLLAALPFPTGCTTYYKDPNSLSTFEVKLSSSTPAQKAGSEKEPLDYISGTSCLVNQCPAGEECIGFCALAGSTCIADTDCATGEYCNKVCTRPLFLDIQAIDRLGKPYLLKGERWVHIQAVPGMVPPPFQYAKLVDGKADDVPVYLAQSIGESYLWVEDIGFGPTDKDYDQCNNEKDDDGDGFIDQADPNCLGPHDPSEAYANYATGLSPPLWFESPRIWHIQYTDEISRSPLDGQNVYVEEGDMIVTNVVANGFFVTDMAGQKPVRDDGTPGWFNSFFFYTFNKPEGIGYGDMICSFTGGVVEYEGNTQMTFPTYVPAKKAAGDAKACKGRTINTKLEVPEPVDVTAMLGPENPKDSDFKNQVMANAKALEPYESSLIRIRDVAAATRFLACDPDEDGQYPNNSDDDACRDVCQADPLCTQLESFFKYSQMAAYTATGKKFFVGIDMLMDNVPLQVPYIGAEDLSGNCPDLVDENGEVVVDNPHKILIGDTLYVEYLCPERLLSAVSGNYRHLYLCNTPPGKKESCNLQMTMLVPRFDADFVFEDE